METRWVIDESVECESFYTKDVFGVFRESSRCEYESLKKKGSKTGYIYVNGNIEVRYVII